MKIYTKIGDHGQTHFFGCALIDKDDPRIEAVGALDELNSLIGISLCFLEEAKLKEVLIKIQHDLFQLGADFTGNSREDGYLPRINPEHIQELENLIDQFDQELKIEPHFVLPQGNIASSFLHFCRAITRRAERKLVQAKEKIEVNAEILCYVNRLSDLFFMLARKANKDIPEQQPTYNHLHPKNNLSA